MSNDDHTTHIINVGGRLRPEDAEYIADAIVVALRRSSVLKSEVAPTRGTTSEPLPGQGAYRVTRAWRKWYHHLRRVTE